MTWLRYLILLLLFIILSLLQISFFPFFSLFGAVPNLVFTLFFTLIFFEDSHSWGEGFFAIASAGVLLDMYLSSYFGLSILVLLAIYFLHKLMMHFMVQNRQKHLIFYFMGMFAASFLIYGFAVQGISLAGLLYSLLFAVAGFYIGRKIFFQGINNQLKLL